MICELVLSLFRQCLWTLAGKPDQFRLHLGLKYSCGLLPAPFQLECGPEMGQKENAWLEERISAVSRVKQLNTL
jgi:hypothetical protein